MAFQCVHCKTTIEDDRLKLPRSGALCPECKKDPTEGWNPYKPEIAEQGKKIAEEFYLRLLTQPDWGVREAALWFLEDMLLEQRHTLTVRLGGKPDIPQRCSVCGKDVPPGEGFHIELYDKWRATGTTIGLCERHTNEGLWFQELDLHANHPDPWMTRGDWQYPTSGKEKV